MLFRSGVPRGAGSYMLTVCDASTGRPVEGVEVRATGAGMASRGAKPVEARTDEDGVAVLPFGNWGAIDLQVAHADANERWMITQDRVAVNGGKASRDPLRLMVGSRMNGGASAYAMSVTRIERGGKMDN